MNKTNFTLIVTSLLILGLTLNFIIKQNGKIASINRIIPLNIPKHSELIKIQEIGDELKAIVRIDTIKYQSFWNKYYSDEKTSLDLHNINLDFILNLFDGLDSLELSPPYYSQYDCERGVIFRFSASRNQEILFLELKTPDWSTNPDCEKLMLNKG